MFADFLMVLISDNSLKLHQGLGTSCDVTARYLRNNVIEGGCWVGPAKHSHMRRSWISEEEKTRKTSSLFQFSYKRTLRDRDWCLDNLSEDTTKVKSNSKPIMITSLSLIGSSLVCEQPSPPLKENRGVDEFTLARSLMSRSSTQCFICDNTLENCFIQISSYSHAYVHIIYEKTKGQIIIIIIIIIITRIIVYWYPSRSLNTPETFIGKTKHSS